MENKNETEIRLTTIASIVYPARNLNQGIDTWASLLGKDPTWQNENFASFNIENMDISLSRLPWVDYPLIFWKVEDIEKAHSYFITNGAKAMVEIADGSLVEIGKGKAVEGNNHNPDTGVVDMPGARLAVLKAADGNLFALTQEVPFDWSENNE